MEILARLAGGLLFIWLVIWAAIYAIVLVLLILVTAAPSTLLGVAVAQLTLFQGRRQFLSSDGQAFAGAVDLRLGGNRLEYEIDERELARHAKGRIPRQWAAILGLLAAALPAVDLYWSGSFALSRSDSLDLSWLPPEVLLVSSLLISGAAVLVTTLGPGPVTALRKALAKRLDGIVAQANAALGQGSASLAALQEEIAELAGRLDIAFPVDHAEEIKEFLLRNGTDVLAGQASLDAVMDRCRDRARRDKTELERALQAHQSALSTVGEAEAALASIRAPRLRHKLEARYEVLTSAQLKSLVANRQWQDHNEVITGILTELRQIRDQASDLATDNGQSDDQTATPAGPMTPERAYRVLGVPPTANDQQLKKVYRVLVSLWHPDAGAVKNDARIKTINLAFDCLKTTRGMA